FPLTVAADVAAHLPAPASPPEERTAVTDRALVVTRSRSQPELAQPEVPGQPGGSVPLTQSVAHALVDAYRQRITAREHQTLRNFVLKPRTPAAMLSSAGPELLGNVLLPPAVRRRIRDLEP